MKKATHSSYDLIRKRFIELIASDLEFVQLTKASQQLSAEKYLDKVFEEIGQFAAPEDKQEMLSSLLTKVVWGLQQLQQYQDNPDVEEIMINGFDNVFVKYRFKDEVQRIPITFSRVELETIIERLLDGTGRRVDRSMPIVDVRIKDGSRVNIVVEPISSNGPVITIRKFPEHTYSPIDLIQFGMIDQNVSNFLSEAIEHKANVLISGGTSTGKTTFISAILHWIRGGDTGDRVVIIEETLELKTPEHMHNVVRLETRPQNSEGKGELTIRDLVKTSLRMRPDRIIVGEARGAEAYDLLQAMNTGHPGSMTTLHANSPETAIDRLESLVLLAGFQELPLTVIRQWIARSIDLVIQIKRDLNQHRFISDVCMLKDNGEVVRIAQFQKGKFVFNKKIAQKFLKDVKEKNN